MELSLVRILLDFGLVVLIWMIQLLVYPSFLYYAKEGLFEWHKKYTQNMFFVVMPLMMGQLVISFIQLFQSVTLFSTCYALFVFALWAITFIWFVPLHGKIADNVSDVNVLDKLVRRNWLRTAFWTFLFILSMGHYLSMLTV